MMRSLKRSLDAFAGMTLHVRQAVVLALRPDRGSPFERRRTDVPVVGLTAITHACGDRSQAHYRPA
jgi:hypothetical protein